MLKSMPAMETITEKLIEGPVMLRRKMEENALVIGNYNAHQMENKNRPRGHKSFNATSDRMAKKFPLKI